MLEIIVIIILFWIREIIIILLEYHSNRLEGSSNNESTSASTSRSLPTSRSTPSVPSPNLVAIAPNQSEKEQLDCERKKEDSELFKKERDTILIKERDTILIKEREAYILSEFAKWNAEQDELKRKADIEASCAALMINSTPTSPNSTSPNSSSNNNNSNNPQPSALLTSASILSTNEKVILIKKELESQLATKRSFKNKVGAKNKKATVTSLETTPAETTSEAIPPLEPLQPVDIAPEIMPSSVKEAQETMPSLEASETILPSIPVDITSEGSENNEDYGYTMDQVTSLFSSICLSDDYIMDSLISSFGSLSLSSSNQVPSPSLIEDTASTESNIENEESIEMENATSTENEELTPVEIIPSSSPSSTSINKGNHDSSFEAVNSECTEEELEERFLRELGWVPPEEDHVSDSEIEEIILKMKSIQNGSINKSSNI